jgi:hypothetical protein
MDEEEWLACRIPIRLLDASWKRTSVRDLRLFVCGCCRRFEGSLTGAWCVPALEVVESFADGDCTAGELAGSRRRCLSAIRRARPGPRPSADDAFAAAILSVLYAEAVRYVPLFEGLRQLARAAEELGRPDEAGAQADLFRCVMGNPFRPEARVERSWLSWNGGTIRQMALGIYDDRAFDRMPVLGDALEDAGCDDEAILTHCRSEAEHVRGCWVLDLLLGKE